MKSRRSITSLAALIAMFAVLGVVSQASATMRYAVPDGTGGDGMCASPGAGCSLRYVLESVILTADEVIVMPGTYDLGTNGVVVRTGSNSVSIHGAAGEPRPTVKADTAGFVFSLCQSTCPADLSGIRHLRIENTGSGSALFVFGGSAGTPVSIDDVEAVSGSGISSLAIMAYAQTGVTSEVTIRNTVAYAPSSGANAAAIASSANLTMRHVTAVAPGQNGIALAQAPMCNDGIGCYGDTSTQVFNSILAGGAADIRTTSSANGCGTCFGKVALDYSNFDTVVSCVGCSVTQAGSAHNQSASPLFTGGNDFHQQPASPTIDAGIDAVANGTTDLDGNPRKLGAAPDIGADEDGHPRPATDAAANVTGTGATLRGSVDPLGFATTYYFDWGTSTDYGNRIPATALAAGSGTQPQAVSEELGGLTPGTTVHYRLVAANVFGSVAAADQAFTTLVPPETQPMSQSQPVPAPLIGSPSQSSFAGVTLNASSLVVKRGRYVLLPLRCPAGFSDSCAGKVKLVATGKRKLTLGSVSFSIRSGATKTVKLVLSRPARARLKATRVVKATAAITATAAGQSKTRTQKVVVKRRAS